MAGTERAANCEGVLTTDLREAYQRDGLVNITLPEEIKQLRDQLRAEMLCWLRYFAPGSFWGSGESSCRLAEPGCDADSESLCADLFQLAQEQRPIIGTLYKVARRFPAVKKLASHDFFVNLAAESMDTTMVSCCNFVSVRIDLPHEEKYMVKSHQDFPYIQGSLNGVTIWLPLEACPLEQGPPAWIPGSHTWGVLPVHEYSLEESDQIGAGIFELVAPEKLPEDRFVQSEIGANEALLFHTLLVHRSSANVSEQARISVQVRFDDLTARDSFRRDYPEGRYLDHRLRASYPEFCLPEENRREY